MNVQWIGLMNEFNPSFWSVLNMGSINVVILPSQQRYVSFVDIARSPSFI